MMGRSAMACSQLAISDRLEIMCSGAHPIGPASADGWTTPVVYADYPTMFVSSPPTE